MQNSNEFKEGERLLMLNTQWGQERTGWTDWLWSWAGRFRQSWGTHKCTKYAKSSEGDFMGVPCEFDDQREIPNLWGPRSFLRALRIVKSSKSRILVTREETFSVLHGIKHKVSTVGAGFLGRHWLNCSSYKKKFKSFLSLIPLLCTSI